ncbi:hypothetical protein [Promicromonospora sp. NPDC050249]|uniref:hypothetical protein n=1 Tax=Promicromonospora sp. NPDC050249 TaxID=3154743 RepID=UPI0033FEE5B3
MTVEPTVAVTTLERALRQLMRREFEQRYGPAWLDHVTTPEQREKWKGRYDQEVARRPGVVAVPSVGLEYSELYELIQIAERHWEPLSGALGKKAKVVTLLEHFERVRNSASHSRELMPFERDLMSGISGEIRNKVTLHMTSTAPDGDPYPRIESVVDSFGDSIDIVPQLSEIAGKSWRYVIVQPGDSVTFTCVGVDAQGRDLEWELRSTKSGGSDQAVSRSGEPVELTWRVQEADIVESNAINIQMSVKGATYHRANGFDHRVFFMYRVRPLSEP